HNFSAVELSGLITVPSGFFKPHFLINHLHVYSNKDYITRFGPLGYAKRFMNNPDYDVRIIPCISSRSDKNLWVADHGFLQPTYRKAWEDHIKNLKREIKFYGGPGENIR
ncbi:MAG: hypothetical protein K2X08_05015, partial [Chlamydiales bacterium]|nr:hypothetical protein [Chlamydiales bacterium]